MGCVFWRVPGNTTPADSDKKVADTVVQLNDDNSGSSDTNNTGEPEDEPEDSRLKSPSFFQQKQHE